MNGEGIAYPGGRGGPPIPPEILASLRTLVELRGSGVPPPGDAGELERFAGRLAEITHLLLGFYQDMQRGMDEFHRVYGIPGLTPGAGSPEAAEFTRRLFDEDGGEARERLREVIQELKVHHAGLLEGYQEAAHEGARQLLEALDPEAIRREYAGSRIEVGPFKLSSRLRPVMVQVVWEEFLRRFAQLKALAPADYERFHRDGFRRGYRTFRDARLGRRSGDADPVKS
jgi:hypothetical protein